MTKLPAVFGICLAAACSNGIGSGSVSVDNAEIGAVSAWAEPTGVVTDKDYMGWTIHFTHAEPGVGCDVAADLVSLASVDVITDQVDTDPDNTAGKAQRAVLAAGDIPVVETFPEAITGSFAVVTVDAGLSMDVSDGRVTISSFGDAIVGTFSATGTEATSPPSQGTITGTFNATRCFD